MNTELNPLVALVNNIKSLIVMGSVTGVFTLYAFVSTAAYAQNITLEQTIREVCTKSDSVRMMQETIKKSMEMVREKKSNAFPVISASVSAARSHGSSGSASSGQKSYSSTNSYAYSNEPDKAIQYSGAGGAPDTNLIKIVQQAMAGMMASLYKPQTMNIYSTGISISQPIYTFGKVGAAIKVAREFEQSAQASFTRNMQTLQLSAIDAFYRAFLAQKATEIAEHSLTRKRELYKFLKRNFDLGNGSKAQVLATKADVSNQEVATFIARRDASTARMLLNVALNRPLTDSTTLDTTVIPQSLQDHQSSLQVDTAVLQGLGNRTDVKSIKLLAQANLDGAQIFKAMYYPTIGAQGSFGYAKTGKEASDFNGKDWNKSWALGVGLSWTIFDGYANSARAAQYRSDAIKLQIATNAISKGIEIEIRTAFSECIAADSNLMATQEMANAAAESYKLTESNFKQGSGQFADLQLSEELLIQSELGLINARYRQIRSRAALLVSMGKDVVQLN